MKRAIFLLALLLTAAPLAARETVNINRSWRFFSDSDGSSDNAIEVNLPHTWNTDALGGKKDYVRGSGNYMKDIRIPKEWRDKRIFIRFHGAATTATLMVNGRHVGQHKGGYTGFTFELTPFLRFGELNTLWVIVNNSALIDVLPTAGDITIYGGIYRDVELIVTEQALISVTDLSSDGVFIRQKKVSAERAEIEAQVNIDAPRERNLIVSMAVTTPRRDTIAFQASKYRAPAQGTGSITIPVTLEKPTLWHGVENPYLYTVIFKLSDDDRVLDSIAVPMGLRYFSVDPKTGFSLNGKPYPLRGVSYYEDRARVGPAIVTHQVHEDVAFMLEMGANAVRAAGYPHNPDFYRECDRRGLIVWSDLPFLGPVYLTDRGYIGTPGFHENGKQQLREMIAQLFNNPSVFMWGIFTNQSLRGDDPTPYIKELNDLALQLDESRMTVAMSNQDGRINFVTDLITWDHVLGWREGLPSDIQIWLQQLQSNWGSLCSALSYGAGASIYHQDGEHNRPVWNGNWHPERWQTFLHEEYFRYIRGATFLWGVFIANMFDYGAVGYTWGDGLGVDDRGLVTFDRKYRKDAFYFYKANWNLSDPFVHIAEKRWDLRTNRMQTIRVFSNATQVELFLNGKSQGSVPGTNGTFVWEHVEMANGINTLEARSAAGIDRAEIEIAFDHLKHGIQ